MSRKAHIRLWTCNLSINKLCSFPRWLGKENDEKEGRTEKGLKFCWDFWNRQRGKLLYKRKVDKWFGVTADYYSMISWVTNKNCWKACCLMVISHVLNLNFSSLPHEKYLFILDGGEKENFYKQKGIFPGLWPKFLSVPSWGMHRYISLIQRQIMTSSISQLCVPFQLIQ